MKESKEQIHEAEAKEHAHLKAEQAVPLVAETPSDQLLLHILDLLTTHFAASLVTVAPDAEMGSGAKSVPLYHPSTLKDGETAASRIVPTSGKVLPSAGPGFKVESGGEGVKSVVFPNDGTPPWAETHGGAAKGIHAGAPGSIAVPGSVKVTGLPETVAVEEEHSKKAGR